MTQPDDPQRSTYNQSVLKAVAVMRCFVDATEGLTLSELSRRTGMHVSTVHRLLQSLTIGGVLKRDEATDRYSPGIVLLALAGSTFTGSGLGAALAVLQDVAGATGESASLGVRDGECVVVLVAAESPQQFRFGHRAGARVPINSSAMGKALLAFGVESPSVAVRGIALPRLTPNTIVDRSRLEDELVAVGARGYAVAEEEQHLGVRSIAVPVRVGDGAAIAAIGLQGPVSRFGPQRDEPSFAVLRAAAEAVSHLPLPSPTTPG